MKTAENLRKWAYKHVSHGRIRSDEDGYDELLDIADSMEAELKHELGTCMQDLASSVNAEYIKLPTDADGEPVHVGDELTNGKDMPAKVRCMVLGEDGWMVSTRMFPGHGAVPTALRHHHAPTVEDVLREFFSRYVTTKPKDEDDAILAEYAAKLRLAGDAE